MISRIYIDNYKCFTSFEYRPDTLQLLLGANGSGKSAIFDILDALRGVVVDGTTSLSAFPPSTVIAGDRRSEQRFELALKGRGGEYVYRLIIEQDRTARKNRIGYEDLCFDGKAIYRFQGGEAHLFRDGGTAGPVFPFEPSRSAIPTFPEREAIAHLSWFRSRTKQWIDRDYPMHVQAYRRWIPVKAAAKEFVQRFRRDLQDPGAEVHLPSLISAFEETKRIQQALDRASS